MFLGNRRFSDFDLSLLQLCNQSLQLRVGMLLDELFRPGQGLGILALLDHAAHHLIIAFRNALGRTVPERHASRRHGEFGIGRLVVCASRGIVALFP